MKHTSTATITLSTEAPTADLAEMHMSMLIAKLVDHADVLKVDRDTDAHIAEVVVQKVVWDRDGDLTL